MPIAAVAQMVAAVVSPRTRSFRRKMVPAPRKPMPVTICAATREGSVWLKPNAPTTVKRHDPSATMVTVRKPAARSWRSRSSPMIAPRTRATRRRTMRSIRLGTALWYCRAADRSERCLGRGEEGAAERVALGIDRGSVTLGEKRLLNGKERVHQLRDANLDLDIGQMVGFGRQRPDQLKDFLQPGLVRHRHSLHALEVHLLQLLQQAIDQLDRPANLVLPGFMVAILPLGVSNISIGLSQQSCHQRTLSSWR